VYLPSRSRGSFVWPDRREHTTADLVDEVAHLTYLLEFLGLRCRYVVAEVSGVKSARDQVRYRGRKVLMPVPHLEGLDPLPFPLGRAEPQPFEHLRFQLLIASGGIQVSMIRCRLSEPTDRS